MEVKSIDVHFVNPKYVSNYTLILPHQQNISQVSVSSTINNPLTNLRFSALKRGKRNGSTEFIDFMKMSLDYCNLTSSFIGQLAKTLYAPLMEKYGNFTIGCPISKGFYHFNLPLQKFELPSFVPRVNAEYTLKGSYRTKISNGKYARVCDGTVYGKISN